MTSEVFRQVVGWAVGSAAEAGFRKTLIQIIIRYVHAVKEARQLFIALFCLGLLASVLCIGMTLFVIGVIALYPIEGVDVAWLSVIIGICLVILSLSVLFYVLKQSRWLDRSRAYLAMDHVLNTKDHDLSLVDGDVS